MVMCRVARLCRRGFGRGEKDDVVQSEGVYRLIRYGG